MQTLKLTKKYEKYPEYKDSGVEWLGKVPQTWELASTRRLFATSKNQVEDRADQYKILSLTLKGVIPRVLDGSGKNPADYATYQEFKKGDLVFCLFDYDVTPRTIGYVNEDGMLTGAYTRLIPKQEAYSKYYYYYYLSLDYTKELLHLCTGLRNSIPKPLFWSMRNPLPDFEEQKKIVSCLDEKTACINEIIEKKQKLIGLLREKRAAVINHAVTSFEGKEEKLKFIAPQRSKKLDVAPLDEKYIGLEHIESGTGRLLEPEEVSQPESSVDVFKKGDVLFGKLRPYLAKVYSPEFDGVCSGEFLTLIPEKKKLLSKFLFYKLISKDFIKTIDDSTYGTKMPRANWQFIGNQVIKYPSLQTQEEIIEKLDLQVELFSKVIQQVERSVALLQEVKSSLISNLVTGKIKV